MSAPARKCFDLAKSSIAIALVLVASMIGGCSVETSGDPQLAKNVYIELVDWHISGLWIVNTPVCWIRVANYNQVPVKDVKIRFKTYGYNGEVVSSGSYVLEGTVAPGSVRNFTEQSVGVVDLESDMLALELDTVHRE